MKDGQTLWDRYGLYVIVVVMLYPTYLLAQWLEAR